MGAWGTAITSDDTVMDVVGTVVDHLKAGGDLNAACEHALHKAGDLAADADDGPLVWLALAHVQWKYGYVAPAVLDQVRRDIATERGLDRWRDNPRTLEKRRKVLDQFLRKISVANPKPASLPRTISRPAPYREGDCLAVRTESGDYTAAIVLAVNNSEVEYGANLVASLDYLSSQPPTMDDFERRQWLYLHHGNWNGKQDILWRLPPGFRKESKRFTVVGSTRLRSSDPQECHSYGSWTSLGEQILLCRANRGEG